MNCERCTDKQAEYRLVTELLDLKICQSCAMAALTLQREVPKWHIRVFPLKGDRNGSNTDG
jgi:hypothetical protein